MGRHQLAHVAGPPLLHRHHVCAPRAAGKCLASVGAAAGAKAHGQAAGRGGGRRGSPTGLACAVLALHALLQLPQLRLVALLHLADLQQGRERQ